MSMDSRRSEPRRPARARVLLVTGASSGIGRAVAERAASRGDSLTLVGRDGAALDEVAEGCRATGARDVHVHAADVGDSPQVAAVVAGILERHGRLDAVVNSAGVVAYGRFEEVPAEIFDGVLRTNVTGAANVAREVLPVLRRQGRGHLLLVGSVIGDIAAPLMTPYAVSKNAVRSLGRQFHLENRDQPDVHVSVVSPGSVDTPIYELAANYLGRPGRPPIPVMTPERVAAAILDVLDRPRPRRQVGWSNQLLRAGFSLAPPVYDALVGPLFAVLASDRTQQTPPTPGAVLEPGWHALRGRHEGPWTILRRNLGAVARQWRS